MLKFSHFAVKKLSLMQSFNNVSGKNRGPLFSLINFDQTDFGCFFSGGFRHGEGVCPREFMSWRTWNVTCSTQWRQKLMTSLLYIIMTSWSIFMPMPKFQIPLAPKSLNQFS